MTNKTNFSFDPTAKFKQEMYNDTGHYQKIYGFQIGKDPQHATWNNEADAFKHAYMQAIGTIRYGVPGAALGGLIHELNGNSSHGQTKGEENMDKWNNRVGRTIGKELKERLKNDPRAKDETYVKNLAAQMVMDAMKQGKLITHPDDPRKFDEFAQLKKLKNLKKKITGYAAPVNDGNTFFATEDIEKMSTDEFINVKDIIDNQVVNKIAIPKSQAQQGAANGQYVYVRGYTRDDGTKVSSYYRKR